MKLSKKEEAAILQVYKTYFDSYKDGDIETITKLLKDDYTQIGSAEAEVFFDKKEAIHFIQNTIDQVAGKAEIRNRVLKAESLDGYVLIIDLFDMYVLMEDEWTFYAKLRASTLMEKTKSGWKFVYQHSSMPDARAQEGNNLAIEKISEENQQLREAVKRRTVELEGKNRELEIEVALEQVRARTMAMQKSEELSDVAVLLYKELINLGVTHFFNCGYMKVDVKNNIQYGWMTSPEGTKMEEFTLPLGGDPVLKKRIESWKNKEEVFFQKVSGSNLRKHIDFVSPRLGSEEVEEMTSKKLPDPTIFYSGNFTHGYLHILSGTPLSVEEENIFVRFTKVFDQTYSRFLDLQKAEFQAREAQIEAALERIRATSLAMHHSDELLKVIKVIAKQFEELGVYYNHVSFGQNNALQEYKFWTAIKDMEEPIMFDLPTIKHPMIDRLKDARKKKLSFFSDTLTVSQYAKWNKHILKYQALGMLNKEQKERLLNSSFARSLAILPNIFLVVVNHKGEPYSEADNMIISRIGKVFEQSYTRFLDLQKVEAQAKEGQIEVALERVRASSMAMHQSSELPDVALTVLNQLDFLGIEDMLCSINIVNPATKNFVSYSAVGIEASNEKVRDQLPEMNLNDIGFLKTVANRLEEGQSFFTLELRDTDLKEMLELWKASNFSALKNKNIAKKPEVIYLDCFQIHALSTISVSSTQHLTNEQVSILRRMANTFSISYTRFLDLQKAEAQARGAKIEAALERVRSKTMAMHNSHDVGVTVVTLFDEVIKLGLDKSIRCGIGILEGTEGMETWSATSSPNNEVDLKMGMLDMTIHPMLIGLKKAWKSGETGYSYDYIGKDVTRYYNALNNEPEYPFFVELDTLPEKEFHNSFFFSEGILFAFTNNPISEEAAKVLNRFAHVFGQTYRRYLDLQNAETQAREAQIEAALERVRARSMAMHKTDELWDVINVVAKQYELLEIKLDTCFINIFEENNKDMNIWIAADGQAYPERVHIPYMKNPAITRQAEARENGESFFTQDLSQKFKDEFFNHFFENATNIIVPKKRRNLIAKGAGFTGSVTVSPHAAITIANYRGKPYSDEEDEIFKRIGKVFEQTYTRFLDLKKAEAREMEAVKQSSLDRVRAEIASMRTADDLNRITPIVWHELTTLGVPFFRCGVFIMDVKAELAHAYLSTPSGSSLTALELKFDSMPLVEGAFKYWQQQKVYIEEWDKKQFIKWTKPLVEQGQIDNGKKYQGGEDAPKHLVLQLVPFKQGMLYVGSAEKLVNDQIELVKSIADAFSVAYARYEDFKQLEEAKGRVENTLIELKSTQTQLIQSEKMASLGELTAGIAHEIQNPLNFVNNFSEVSGELVEEINEELKAGNLEDVEEITTDLKQNLEKINHHGQRASGIVKGMLEHSRTGSGIKELTDINKLADEYLRLSYHGLRAKDKSFNANFKTDFDESLTKVNVISQDLGRVLLNLINNAFYACTERSRSTDSKDYKPTVTITSRKKGDNIEIGVRDNGAGIPEDIKDKIFQPFFTTKPTGSGTGLGLSMSYDIITKGHRGELKVVTKEGEGTEFIIIVPL